MSLLTSPTGHLSNLSAMPLHRGTGEGPTPETPTTPVAGSGYTCCDFGRYSLGVDSWNQCSCWSSEDVQSCQDATYQWINPAGIPGAVATGTPVDSCPSYESGQCCFAPGGGDGIHENFGGTPVTSDYCECWSGEWTCENAAVGPATSVASCPPPRSASSRAQRGMDFKGIVERINTPLR